MAAGDAPLLFDFDGVIADTFHIAHGVAKKLCVFLTDIEYRRSFEGNIYDKHAALQSADHGDLCDHTLDWWGEYAPGFKTHAKPFAEMVDLVARFAKSHPISIVSSSHEALIVDFLQKYELTSAIAGIYGVEADPHKDVKFKTIFAKYGVEPGECLFVTDTLGDVNEATTVGLRSIGVTWGFQDRHTLERGTPYAIVDTPAELSSSIETYFAMK